MDLSGGANPMFGLNALGGALLIRMKNGFNTSDHSVEVTKGSFNREIISIESSLSSNKLGYYVNLHYFGEDGWRDHSASRAVNAYASLDWRSESSDLSLNLQQGKSELNGNGASPVELLNLDRNAFSPDPISQKKTWSRLISRLTTSSTTTMR